MTQLGMLMAALVAAPSLSGEPGEPRLVRDIRTEAEPTLSGLPWVVAFTEFDGAVLFPGWDGIHGWELWRSDGTVEGTRIVKDICPGHCSSTPFDLRRMLGAVYFRAADGTHGTELWRTDGTPGGTTLVVDLAPGAESSFPLSMAELDGEVFFQARTPTTGPELWATNGSEENVRLVLDLVEGAEGSDPRSLFTVGDKLYFSADDGETGREPWLTDGSAGGTQQLLDVCPGPAASLWEDQEGPWGQSVFAASNGRLVLSTHDTWDCPPGVWVSDGTKSGMERIPGVGYALFLPEAAPDGSVLMSAEDAASDRELWRTDGTVGGSHRVADINPTGSSHPRPIGRAGDVVYFSAWDGVSGTELWRTDGTATGTRLVRDIRPGPESSISGAFLATGAALGDELLFTADDGVHGREPWSTDGTANGTRLTTDVNPGPADSNIFLNSLVFPAGVSGILVTTAYNEAHGWALWSSDATPGGTTLLADIDTQTSSARQSWWGELPMGWFMDKAVIPRGVVWEVQNVGNSEEIWVSDGTEAGTSLLRVACDPCDEFAGGFPRPVTAVGDRAYWWSWDSDPPGVWGTDGTPHGTVLLAEAAQGFQIEAWSRRGSDSVLMAGSGLWISEGTPESTVQLSDAPWVSDPTSFGDVAFFGVQELWVTDGTPEGTELFADIRPGDESADVLDLTRFANAERLFFRADDGIHGREPWVSDGTVAGTVLLADLKPGPGSSSLLARRTARPVATRDTVFFGADDGVTGVELWASDGTGAGTRKLGDLNPGAVGSDPRPLVVWDEVLYFAATDTDHGRELWRTDGTPEGTRRVHDINPGPGSALTDMATGHSSSIAALSPTVFEGRLYFAATDGLTGLELWSTDGTSRGTSRVADLYRGPGSSSPNGFATFDGQLFFTATDGVRGYELWALGEPPTPEVLFTDGFESGDTTAWSKVAG